MKHIYTFTAIVLLIALTSANTCIFDTNLGRLSCLPSENTTLKGVNATSDIIPSYSYLKTNMTPDIWKGKIRVGLAKIINGTLNTSITVQQAEGIMGSLAKQVDSNPIMESSITYMPPKPAPENVPVSRNHTENRTQTACQNDFEKDWQAYCWSMWSQGMHLDCWNANQVSKYEIRKNMEQIRGCAYAK